jgi:hypothetical protein
MLLQNYPNPFNPATRIRFGVSGPASGWVRLNVYDMLGGEVAGLVDERKPAGEYTVTFDAKDLASGVYICRLAVDGLVSVRSMVLLR